MTNNENPINNQCLLVESATVPSGSDTERGETKRSLVSLPLEPLKRDNVRIEVAWSSLNYKDALCASGHPGVARTLPIVPGIDAAGRVVESNCDKLATGQSVTVFHAEFGTASHGGYRQFIEVPSDWVYPIPDSISPRQAMIIGTAGFTAAQCVDELQKHSIEPDDGEVVVSGATGGVGIFAVMLLAKLGYRVVASTGKPERSSWLKSLGATEVIGREELNDTSERTLLKGRWAGAVDTVGGNTLATILRSTNAHGCVTACGLVGGTDFSISVYPFILRGVTLQGIDTALISREYRAGLWQRLGSDWKLDNLDELATEVSLGGLEEKIEMILNGKVAGRVVVKLADN